MVNLLPFFIAYMFKTKQTRRVASRPTAILLPAQKSMQKGPSLRRASPLSRHLIQAITRTTDA